MPTVREIFETMRSRATAHPEKVAHLNAAYQFEVTGSGGGVFHAVFENGSHDIGEGAIANPGCTITLSSEDFQALVAGKLNPAMAFMTRKITLQGDMGLAMKLQSIIGQVRSGVVPLTGD